MTSNYSGMEFIKLIQHWAIHKNEIELSEEVFLQHNYINPPVCYIYCNKTLPIHNYYITNIILIYTLYIYITCTPLISTQHFICT